MKEIDFLHDELTLEKKRLEEIAKIAERKVDPRLNYNALILRRFTKSLILAAARRYKKQEQKNVVQEIKKPMVTEIKPQILTKVPIQTTPIQKVEEKKMEVPRPQFNGFEKPTEYPLVVTLDTNKMLAKAVIKNHEYFLEEPVLTTQEDLVVYNLKNKLVNKLVKKPDIINKKEFIMRVAQKYCKKFGVPFNNDNFERFRYFLVRDVLGYGKVDALLKDKNVREIRCDVFNKPVVIKYNDGENIETNVTFGEKDKLEKFIKKLFGMAKQKIKSGVNYLDTDIAGMKVKALLDTTEQNLNFDIKKL